MSDSLLIWNTNADLALRKDAEAFRELHNKTVPEMDRKERGVARWHRFTICLKCKHHHDTIFELMINVNGYIAEMRPQIQMGNAQSPVGFWDCSAGSHSHVHHEPDPEAAHE